jgi:hypothetical protein
MSVENTSVHSGTEKVIRFLGKESEDNEKRAGCSSCPGLRESG